MKKIILPGCAIAVVVIIAIFVFINYKFSKGSDFTQGNVFSDVYTPKKWKIVDRKTTGNNKIYRVHSKDFFKGVIIIRKTIGTDEASLRAIINEIKLANLTLTDYKMFFNKRINSRMVYIRFVKTNSKIDYSIDIIVKKLNNSSVAFICSKGGMYIKTNSAEDEPLDVNVKEFMDKMEKEML